MYFRGEYDQGNMVDALRIMETVVEDVDCQYELYLANTYTLEQLQHMDHSTVALPCEWFTQWLSQLVQSKDNI